jgi:hypothetical protein
VPCAGRGAQPPLPAPDRAHHRSWLLALTSLAPTPPLCVGAPRRCSSSCRLHQTSRPQR